MMRFSPAAVLFGLFCPALVHAQQSPPNALDQTVTAITWSAEYMKDLPADYQERQRASLVAGTNRLGRLNFNTSTGTDSIGWIRYGMPALILGQRAQEINQFFESDKFVVSANPKFGFSLFGVSYFRMYGLMNH